MSHQHRQLYRKVFAAFVCISFALSVSQVIGSSDRAAVSLVSTSNLDDSGPSSPTSIHGSTATLKQEPQISDFRPHHPAFVATHEWKEVKDGQPVPPGLEIRFDLEQGKKFAKLPDKEAVSTGPEIHLPAENSGSTSVKNIPVVQQVVWGTEMDIQPVDATPLPEISNLTDSLKQLLLDLPQPEEELVEGIRNQLSEEEMEKIYRRVWMRRQEEIHEAFKASRDDASLIKRLLGTIVRGRGDQEAEVLKQGLAMSTIYEQLAAMVDLEDLVSDIDHAGDFFHFGGLNVVADALSYGSNDMDRARVTAEVKPKAVENGNIDPIWISNEVERLIFDLRAKSAWVLGTAVKNDYGLQQQATNAMVLSDVVDLISTSIMSHRSKAASKGLYCLGSILRHNPPAQEQLLHVGGLEKIESVILQLMSLSVEAYDEKNDDTSQCTTLDHMQMQFLQKIMSLFADLMENIDEDTRPTHPSMVCLILSILRCAH